MNGILPRAGLLWLLALIALSCGVERNIRQGRQAIAEHDLARAEAAWRRALDKEPSHPEALYGLGWTYHLAGQPSRARGFFERCIELHPSHPLGYKGLGSVALVEGNLQAAEQHLEQALALGLGSGGLEDLGEGTGEATGGAGARLPENWLQKGDTAILNSLALARIKSGKPERAVEIYRVLRRRDPGNSTLALGLGEALLRADRQRKALEVVEEALGEADSDGSDSQRSRGLLLQLRARVLIALTAGRLDPSRCGETAPPLLAWLDRARADLEAAEKLEVEPADLHATRRLLLRRQAAISERCPLRAGSGEP